MLVEESIHVTVVGNSQLLRQSLVNFFTATSIAAESVQMSDSLARLSPVTNIILFQYVASRLRTLHQLASDRPDAKLLLFDVDAADEIDIVGCLQLGVVGFLPVNADCAYILDAVQAVVADRYVLPEQLQYRLYRQLHDRGRRQNHSVAMQLNELTLRERQIIELISEGFSNKEIADKLNISTYTVKSHVHHILSKLKVATRVGLVNSLWKKRLVS